MVLLILKISHFAKLTSGQLIFILGIENRKKILIFIYYIRIYNILSKETQMFNIRKWVAWAWYTFVYNIDVVFRSVIEDCIETWVSHHSIQKHMPTPTQLSLGVSPLTRSLNPYKNPFLINSHFVLRGRSKLKST